MTLPDADLALLRRFEPILKFTNGEMFFPMATGPFVEACDLLEGPTLREAKIVVPAGELDLERLGAVDDPPPGHSQYLRFVPKPMNAVELNRWRGRPDAPVFDAPGPAGPRRPRRATGRCRPGDLVAAARPRPRWDGRRGLRPLRGDPSPRSADGLPRAGPARRPVDRPPLPVLLRDERLALDVRRRQRPRVRLGAVLRHPGGPPRTATSSRPGSARPPTTRRATTCAGAGTTRGWSVRRASGRLPRRRLARDLSRARRVHHGAAVPRRAEPAQAARPAPPPVARHARPAGPGRPGRQGSRTR